MTEWTEDKTREFWEGYGLKQLSPTPENPLQIGCWGDSQNAFVSFGVPALTLDNLVKVAVLKLGFFTILFDHIETSGDYYVTLTDFYLTKPCRKYRAQHKDPALALRDALWEMLRRKRK